MNKKIIYVGVAAVAAFLLYKKFMTKSGDVTKTEEQVAVEEQTAEETPQEGGGGGGGGGAPAPESPKAPSKGKDLAKEREGKGQVKTMAKPMGKPMASRPMGKRPNVRLSKPRPIGITRTGGNTNLRNAPSKAVMVRRTNFMDFDGFPDGQAYIM